MRDLLLWRELLRDELDADRALPLLGELALVPMKQRFPFFGRLEGALRHEDVRVRAAALRVLSGAEGPLAYPAIVRALDDRSADVRLAAVEALRVSATTHPGRWVHALYHHDPDVRRAAVSGRAPLGAQAWSFYLLADSACAEVVRPRVVLPNAAIPSLLDFARRGIVGDDETRRWISEMSWKDFSAWLAGAHARSVTEVSDVLASRAAMAHGSDALDDLFALFFTDTDAAGRKKTFHKLADVLRANAVLRPRVVASLLVTARREGFVPEAAELCTIFHPAFLSYGWVPREARYASLGALYRTDAATPRITDAAVRPLLDLDLARGTHGELDLWAVGAMLRYLHRAPYETLLGWFTEKEIVGAFLKDMERSAPFLSIHDESPKGRAHLIERIVAGAPGRRGELLALLAHVAGADELAFLESLDVDDSLGVLSALFVLQERPGFTFAPNKVERLAQILGTRGALEAPDRFLRDWLGHKSPEALSIGVSVLGVLGRTLDTTKLVATCAALDTFLLKRLVAALPYAPGVSYGVEVALAHALLGHVSPPIHDWARRRVPEEGAAPVTAPRRGGVTPISPSLAGAIALAGDADLPDTLEPCLGCPTIGLTAALRARGAPPTPCLTACVALLGSHDDPVEVAIELERFGGKHSSFVSALDAAAIRTWQGSRDLALIGHAMLHRFEAHAFALVEWMQKRRGGIAAQLAGALMLRSDLACAEIWRGVARVLCMWRWRDRERLTEAATEGLVELLVSHLDTAVGEPAAKAFVAIYLARAAPEIVESLRPRVDSLLPDLADAVRGELEPFVASRGLPSRPGPLRPRTPPDEEILCRIRACDDLDALEAWCAGDDERLVHEAALRLILAGDDGSRRLSGLLDRRPLPPCFRAIADSISLWPDGHALTELRSRLRAGIDDPELRFRASLALVERGEAGWLHDACDALLTECETGWFREADFDRLEARAPDRSALYRALGPSAHPHAYREAVGHLLDADDPDEATRAAVRAFLETGTERIGDLRRRAAWWLHRLGDHHGFPILVADAFQDPERHTALFEGAAAEVVAAAVDAALVAGQASAPESHLLAMLVAERTDRDARDAALERLLIECEHPGVRQSVVSHVAGRFTKARKLRRVANVFAWGTRIGRELAGRLFRFHMIGGTGLGYTRLNENRVFVSPLPLLRGDRHGTEIVEALVLHEIGHHIYHRGEKEAEVWKRAGEEGIAGLLNLVADEHLERNLRATDASFGDRLKRLAAYAFQHADKEIPVVTLFEMLQGRTFEVLTRVPLGVARAHDCLRVENGTLLLEMEKAGLRFARFVRALRMGLGNRHDDPLIAQGLELFGKAFRKGDMQSLLDVSHRLRELFGWEVRICETFGGHETVVGDGPESTIHGEGITDDEVQREVERVLDPKAIKRQPTSGTGRGGKLILNVAPDEQFDPITEVVKVPHDPERHRPIAVQVARQARRMRRYLERLGLSLVPQRMRLSGRRFDPSRARAVVLRGDPRMLIARETRVTNDLYLGVVVDCSGSMYGASMDKAHAFGVLLAEAARGLPNVDVGFYGFTDRVIYDAGDSRYPAVASLEAGGGNNDAAALSYVAGVAKRSKRRAKLLVMISDGLPTECSVEALRGLVRTLTRRERMCCAQVAVRPLEEVCFPHYVELTEDALDPAVARFGTIVAGLVRKAMRT